ncbi:haloacid dehalogenase type II [Denitromonas iodatirespirans]|uniref:(S)-2-haloacid dehalogenase n=1 Tax=Denitromonas iodatirespirans TaxID=2795389 RepID=A0A944HDR1_DENI1|nr:haloacid dehalogenase type II [Denitromonas iodatirespirans]MBT0963997.1 haloacid dehalogenase type II [Denitromonas iodatirespirans]
MPQSPIRAIAFDAFGTLFDVFSVTALAERLFPGQGDAVSRLWRLKQIEYSFLRTLSKRYEPFDAVTESALHFALSALGVSAGQAQIDLLMAQYDRLTPFPENLAVLQALKADGVPMAILSNGTPRMLEVCTRHAGMSGVFDHLLSVDTVGQYKTTEAAYQLAPDAFGVPAREILFVSSNGWDAAGAGWFGFTTFWINRSAQPPEALGVAPAATGTQLTDVLDFVRRHRQH